MLFGSSLRGIFLLPFSTPYAARTHVLRLQPKLSPILPKKRVKSTKRESPRYQDQHNVGTLKPLLFPYFTHVLTTQKSQT